jgi:hypothetical protein
MVYCSQKTWTTPEQEENTIQKLLKSVRIIRAFKGNKDSLGQITDKTREKKQPP